MARGRSLRCRRSVAAAAAQLAVAAERAQQVFARLPVRQRAPAEPNR